MTHSARFAWRSPHLGHFADVDATCVLDLESTCHTGGWCFGSLFNNWRVDYAPRIKLEGTPSMRGPFCEAWWLSDEPLDQDEPEFADCGHWCASGHCTHEAEQ